MREVIGQKLMEKMIELAKFPFRTDYEGLSLTYLVQKTHEEITQLRETRSADEEEHNRYAMLLERFERVIPGDIVSINMFASTVYESFFSALVAAYHAHQRKAEGRSVKIIGERERRIIAKAVFEEKAERPIKGTQRFAQWILETVDQLMLADEEMRDEERFNQGIEYDIDKAAEQFFTDNMMREAYIESLSYGMDFQLSAAYPLMITTLGERFDIAARARFRGIEASSIIIYESDSPQLTILSGPKFEKFVKAHIEDVIAGRLQDYLKEYKEFETGDPNDDLPM